MNGRSISHRVVSSAALLLLAAAAPDAGAAPRQFSISYDSRPTPEGDVEIESWTDFGHPSPEDPTQQNMLWWFGLRNGVFDHLEIATFVVVQQASRANKVEPGEELSGLLFFIVEGRWHPVREQSAFDPYVMVQYVHWGEGGDPEQIHLSSGATWRLGRVLLAGEIGYWDSTEFREDGALERWRWVNASAGASAAIVQGAGTLPALAAGVEVWTLDSLDKDVPGGLRLVHGASEFENKQVQGDGFYGGPSMSFTRGRIWGAGHVGLLLDGARREDRPNPAMIRVMLGIAL